MRSHNITTLIFCADIFGVCLRARKAFQRSNESAPNTQLCMEENCFTRSNCLPLGGVRLQRHMNLNDCSPHRLRFNGNRSIHQSNALAHASETKTLASRCYLNVETPA